MTFNRKYLVRPNVTSFLIYLIWVHNMIHTFIFPQLIGRLWGGPWWARWHPQFGLCVELLLQVLWVLEEVLLHHCHHPVWLLHCRVLGLRVLLHCLQQHLVHHSCFPRPGCHNKRLQASLHPVHELPGGAMLHCLWQRVQCLQEIDSIENWTEFQMWLKTIIYFDAGLW